MNLFDILKQMRMLLIDDDEWIRDSLSLFFDGEGCYLLAVETAEEGLEELRKGHYDIIIADYRLPGMDGLSFFNRIHDSHPETMKILITAYGSEDVLTEAKRSGIESLIQKPFTAKSFENALTTLIQGRQAKD